MTLPGNPHYPPGTLPQDVDAAQEWPEAEELGPRDMLSVCCGRRSLGELSPHRDGSASGTCSGCRNHATFEPETRE